jgi:hypothetical protein
MVSWILHDLRLSMPFTANHVDMSNPISIPPSLHPAALPPFENSHSYSFSRGKSTSTPQDGIYVSARRAISDLTLDGSSRYRHAKLEEDGAPQTCSSTQLLYWTHGL